MTTLFDQLGGAPAVDLAVDKFYERVLRDERIKHFFANVNMTKQRAHQKAFLTYAFGGTDKYDGRYMREAHQELVANHGLNSEHFDAVAEDLMLTLEEMGVSEELRSQVAAIAAAPQHKRDVLNQ
ncbi:MULTISPECIES: group 1 truncated hemoglobin [Cyanophyceae]|uniref:group I truncated hemoglobin n=1 Tax=Cyanophyceae TaxID=3028117 RepID=UPI001689A97E|nr:MULTISPECIES: group 1 truncated hemoglobin [Cyanophyceae]MBD1914704.1 group 1 truncated hemoglobin [Phormidium sp. FACHB-77]MBD2032592.1 group 1 truncated hemoglobin [Phormidium sp. FACHB-322]MBD2049450.1 group 1 truncated hemoglobin [Leptolyngbya sp. FACHB-60]